MTLISGPQFSCLWTGDTGISLTGCWGGLVRSHGPGAGAGPSTRLLIPVGAAPPWCLCSGAQEWVGGLLKKGRGSVCAFGGGVHGIAGVTSLQWVGRTGLSVSWSLTPMAPSCALLLEARPLVGQPAIDRIHLEGLLENFWSKGQVTGQSGVRRSQ